MPELKDSLQLLIISHKYGEKEKVDFVDTDTNNYREDVRRAIKKLEDDNCKIIKHPLINY
jgi:hypothetical protein